MSDTPRTDDVEAANEGKPLGTVRFAMEHHARNLERELSRLKEELAAMTLDRDAYMVASKMRPLPFAGTDAGLVQQVKDERKARERAEARLAECEKDAARYRWLRQFYEFSGVPRTWHETVEILKNGDEIVRQKSETFWDIRVNDMWRLCMTRDEKPSLEEAIDQAMKEEKQ